MENVSFDQLEKPNREVIADLAIEQNRKLRLTFADCVLIALTRAGYQNHRDLHRALQKRKQDLGEIADLSLAYWQHFYHGDEDRIAAIPCAERLAVVARILLPHYRDKLWLLTSHRALATTIGVGSSYPPEARLSIAEAFAQWLKRGRNPVSAADLDRELSGEYAGYFPWFEKRGWTGSIAKVRARIRRENDEWIFESVCNPGPTGPLLFSGQVRFTSTQSAILVGFTSFPLPEVREKDVALREDCEMLVHPYRLPNSVNGWWHGSTSFIDVSSLEYLGTVGHVMRRVSSDIPSDLTWHREVYRQTDFLTSVDSEYGRIKDGDRPVPTTVGTVTCT